MKYTFRRFSIPFTIVVALLLAQNTQLCAQLTLPTSNTAPPNFDLPFCNTVTCPTPGQQTVTNTPVTLNADMATIEDNGFTSACYPAYWGINTTLTNLWGVAFSGVNNTDLTNKAGFTIGTSTSILRASFPIPYWFGVGYTMTATVNDPDIAVGTCYSSIYSDYRHFALVVYEHDGDIYMDHYEVIVTTGGIATIPPEPFTCVGPPGTACAIPGNSAPIKLTSNANQTASKPHIEIWHSRNIPAASSLTIAEKFAVTWQQEDPANPGVMQVWGIDGEIDDPGNITFPTPNQAFPIGNGKQPDVVAVNFFDPSGAAGTIREVAYVTYVSNNPSTATGRDVMLSDWDYNTQTVNSTTQLNTASTTNDDEFQLPRISGPMFYNVGTASVTEPICVVVVNDNDAASTNVIDKVTAFKYYDPSLAGTPVIEKLDISDHNNIDGFSSNTQTAIMPVVSGIGTEIFNLAGSGIATYDNYPVAFYSNYLTGAGQNGDFYSFGLQMPDFINAPFLAGGTDYMELNDATLDNGSAFDMINKPSIAIATANNTGYDLLTTYYEGLNLDKVTVTFTGTTATYAYKPGKSTGIDNIGKDGYAVYPNPVVNHLNIAKADGADYTVMDMMGRTLATGSLSGNKASIDAASYASGIYILQLTKDGHTEKVKFVKQ